MRAIDQRDFNVVTLPISLAKFSGEFQTAAGAPDDDDSSELGSVRDSTENRAKEFVRL